MGIIPSHYSLLSYAGGVNTYHLRNWVIEVSNDAFAGECIEIDRRDECADLNGAGASRCYEISHPPEAEFRSIRLRQTGKNWHNDDWLIFSGFEVFGELIVAN